MEGQGHPQRQGLPQSVRPSDNGGQGGPNAGQAQKALTTGPSRAERFEDEKRRIIESCFSKVDQNGQLSESYITHIRVIEDASSPSAPPPPDSAPDNKKPRVIVIAVRNTGRVRVHKARENSNGSFSIGKTWNMEELSAVESFSGGPTTSQEDARRKQWGGATGFLVTIAKPYYWQANTAKEKEFFIASLVKIYRKYTQGKVPQLIGFDPRERDAMVGPQPQGQASSPGPQQPPQQSPQLRGPVSPQPGQEVRSPPLNGMPGGAPPGQGLPFPGRQQRPITPNSQVSQRSTPESFNPPQRPGRPEERQLAPGQRGPSSQSRTPPPPQQREAFRQPRPRRSQEQGLRQAMSREQMRPGQYPPGQHPHAPQQRLTPQSSQYEFPQQRSRSPDGSSVSSRPPSSRPNESPNRQRPLVDGPNGTSRPDPRFPEAQNSLLGSTIDRWGPNASANEKRDLSPAPLRPSTAHSASSFATSNSEDSVDNRQQPLPERRRPQLPPSKLSEAVGTGGTGTPDSFRTPLATPGAPREEPRFDLPKQEEPPRELPRTRDNKHVETNREPPRTQQHRRNASDVELFLEPSPPLPQEERISAPPVAPAPVAKPQPQPQSEKEIPPARPSQDAAQPSAVSSEVPPPMPGAFSPEAAATPEQVPSPQDEEEKPGLGSMFRKKQAPKELANTFRKAATAYNAFKPRAGGAGERLLGKQQPASNEPDGITAVVPAPSLKVAQEQVKPASATTEEPTRLAVDTEDEVLPEVTVSSPKSPVRFSGTTLQEAVASPAPAEPVTEEVSEPVKHVGDKAAEEKRAEEARRQRRRSNQQAKYLALLDINPNLLEGRGLDFEATLDDFGWGKTTAKTKKVDTLEADIRRELGRVEAGSWLGSMDQKDDRIDTVEKMLDRAIAECEELEGLLTLYGVELSSLNDDIAFIEAQSQGLQVQTANQKLLQAELQNLVTTISITPKQLKALKGASINTPDGLAAIESSLVLLYKALLTIDPALRQHDVKQRNNSISNNELSEMRALQEKKDAYLSESATFLQRLKQFMDMTFAAALMETKDALAQRSLDPGPAITLDPLAHDAARRELWRYSPLMLFAKEIDVKEWENLIAMYQARARNIYQDEFRDCLMAWKKLARKPTGDEQDLLFTSQEKDSEGITSTARKLTVKRSQTLAKMRVGSGDKASATDKDGNARPIPCDAFAGALEAMAPLIFQEQNFVVDFFHATSAENIEFVDAVATSAPEDRRGTNVQSRHLFEPDKAMARRVADVMEGIYPTWADELQGLIETAIKADPLQGIGILCAIERRLAELEDTNQDFLNRELQKMRERLTGMFTRFVDEQIRAIEDTKVKIKKRKGVIGFMKTFPQFSAAIEEKLPAADGPERLDIRMLVDDGYQRINRAMFDSLKVIAKESPTAMVGANVQGQNAGGDPEDKEALNYHILLIENMNHYLEEVDERGDHVLADWMHKASLEMNEHLELYLAAVIRRPLGKLLDFLESTEVLLQSTSPAAIAQRASHSRSTFKKLLSTYDSKEIRKGIDTLKKRIDKHFGDADDPGISRNLVHKVYKQCEKRYDDALERTKAIVETVYEGGVEVEWRREDVSAAFRR